MQNGKLRDFLKPFVLSDIQLKNVFNIFCNEIRKGLSQTEHDQADTKCYVTYVQNLPTGDEIGKYLALDLGGTNFRVLLVILKGQHEAVVKSTIYAIPKEIMTGSGEQLFDHIAQCLSKFKKEYKVDGERLPLGFTFSFPCFQLGLAKALLVRWTKGFKCSGVEEKDVGRLLKEALVRRGECDIDIVAILNDTTGTLMSCAHRNPECRIGVIVGTGCNACYVERVENVDLLDSKYKVKSKNIVINTEWGAFGDSGILDFVRTGYDKILDMESLNPGTQTFEKMISGMYLGELVRLILIDAVKKNLVFLVQQNKEQIIEKLSTECFESSMISAIESDTYPEFEKTRNIIKLLFQIENFSVEECEKVRYVCKCISERAASLVAVGISVLISRINEPKVIVGIDGSVYRFHPKIDGYMRSVIKKMISPKIEFDLMLSEDGSGRGAALVAAVASNSNYYID